MCHPMPMPMRMPMSTPMSMSMSMPMSMSMSMSRLPMCARGLDHVRSLHARQAFRFPVTRSYSSLCVTLMESDTHAHAGFIRHLDSDDILGRVTVRLGTLVAKTEYDCTMARCPLAQAHAPPHPPQLRRLTDVYTFVRVRSWCRLVPTALARV